MISRLIKLVGLFSTIILAIVVTAHFLGGPKNSRATVAEDIDEIELLKQLARWRTDHTPLDPEVLETANRLPSFESRIPIKGLPDEFFFKGNVGEQISITSRLNDFGVIMFGQGGRAYLSLSPDVILPLDAMMATGDDWQDASLPADYTGNEQPDAGDADAEIGMLQLEDRLGPDHPLVFKSSYGYREVTADTPVAGGIAELLEQYQVWAPASQDSLSKHLDDSTPPDEITPVSQQGGGSGPNLFAGNLVPLWNNSSRTAVLWGQLDGYGFKRIYVQHFGNNQIYGPIELDDLLLPPCRAGGDATGFLDQFRPSTPGCDREEQVISFTADYFLSANGRYAAVSNISTGEIRVYDVMNEQTVKRVNLNSFPEIAALVDSFSVAASVQIAIGDDGKTLAVSLAEQDKDIERGYNPLGLFVIDLNEPSYRVLVEQELATSTGFVPPLSYLEVMPDEETVVMVQNLTLEGRRISRLMEYSLVDNKLATIWSGTQPVSRPQVSGSSIAARIANNMYVWGRHISSHDSHKVYASTMLPKNQLDAVIDSETNRLYVLSFDPSAKPEDVYTVDQWPSLYEAHVFQMNSLNQLNFGDISTTRHFQDSIGQPFDLTTDGSLFAQLVRLDVVPDGNQSVLNRRAQRGLAVRIVNRKTGDTFLSPFSAFMPYRGDRGAWAGIFFTADDTSLFVVDLEGRRYRLDDLTADNANFTEDSRLLSPTGSNLTGVYDIRQTHDKKYLFGQVIYRRIDGTNLGCLCVWNPDDGTVINQMQITQLVADRAKQDLDPETLALVNYSESERSIYVFKTQVSGAPSQTTISLAEDQFLEGISVIPDTSQLGMFLSYRNNEEQLDLIFSSIDLENLPRNAKINPQLGSKVVNHDTLTDYFDLRYAPRIRSIAWSDDNKQAGIIMRDNFSFRDSAYVYKVRREKHKPDDEDKSSDIYRFENTAYFPAVSVRSGYTRHAEFIPDKLSGLIVSNDPVSNVSVFHWNVGAIRKHTCNNLRHLKNKNLSYADEAYEAYIGACESFLARAVIRLQSVFQKDEKDIVTLGRR